MWMFFVVIETTIALLAWALLIFTFLGLHKTKKGRHREEIGR